MRLKPEDHFDHLLDLLELELEADRERFRAEIQALPLKERVRRGFTWHPLTLVKTGYMVGDRAFVVLERPAGRRRDSSIKGGSPVRWYTTKTGVERPDRSAVVHWVKDTEIMLVLGGRRLPDWAEAGAAMAVDLEFDENSYKEMRLALERANHAKGRHKHLTYVLTGRTEPAFGEDDPYGFQRAPAMLNDSQRGAIDLVLRAEDLAIIHGPPGTGKTTTLVAAVQAVLHSEQQVLVCAPSNVAVDLLAERLHRAGVQVVRTGHISRVDEELLHLTLDQQVSEHPEHKQIRRIKLEAQELRKQAGTHKRKFSAHDRRERGHLYKQAGELDGWARQLERRILDEVIAAAQVVCCTLTGAGADFLRDRKFSTLFVDEAAQALEPAMWIPLQRARRLIMAGDPHQLPPTVKSQKAARAGLSVTMMERLLAERPGATALLRTQYRMHGAIMGFSNAYFYGGQLEAAPGVVARGLPLEGEPAVRFIDTAGAGFAERRNPETRSRYNEDEYLLLATYLYGYRERFGMQEGTVVKTSGFHDWPTIALISPYREQVERMRAEVAEDPLLSQLDIVVHTVDGFQGQERDWVLVSLVRDNPGGDIGFLRDYRRMNVAMTRARMQLVVVGDSATIGNDPFYAAFLDYVESADDAEYASAFAYMQST